MHYPKTATVPTMFVLPVLQSTPSGNSVKRIDPDNEDAVLLLKPTAAMILRTQGIRSILHAHTGALTRAKNALESGGCPNTACAEQIPLIRIAILTIGADLASAKMALLNIEEALREVRQCASALQVDTALAKAATLVIEDCEKERAILSTMLFEVRQMYQTYRNTLN